MIGFKLDEETRKGEEAKEHCKETEAVVPQQIQDLLITSILRITVITQVPRRKINLRSNGSMKFKRGREKYSLKILENAIGKGLGTVHFTKKAPEQMTQQGLTASYGIPFQQIKQEMEGHVQR